MMYEKKEMRDLELGKTDTGYWILDAGSWMLDPGNNLKQQRTVAGLFAARCTINVARYTLHKL
jgi:hypothetical protein